MNVKVFIVATVVGGGYFVPASSQTYRTRNGAEKELKRLKKQGDKSDLKILVADQWKDVSNDSEKD